MTHEAEKAYRAAGIDPEQVKTAIDYLHQMEQRGSEGQEARRAFVRALAELARENNVAKTAIENRLEQISGQLAPENVDTFRAYYLDGDKRPNPRSLSRRLYVDVGTIYRRNRKVIDAMIVPFFGVDGVEFV